MVVQPIPIALRFSDTRGGIEPTLVRRRRALLTGNRAPLSALTGMPGVQTKPSAPDHRPIGHYRTRLGGPHPPRATIDAGRPEHPAQDTRSGPPKKIGDET